MTTDKMRKKRDRNVKLPDEMLFEILSWLPAKSVCISKCCCKSFLHFTNSPNFALKKSQNSLLKDDSYFFIHDYFEFTKIYSLLPSSSSATDQIPRDKVGVPSKFLHYVDENDVDLFASSNGLLLCQIELQLFICNPITQLHSSIPRPFFTRDRVMFSFECNNNNDEDYKLYALQIECLQSPHNSDLVCQMFIPKEGPFTSSDKISGGSKYVASYNVESGVSRMIELPDGVEDEDKQVGIFKWGEVGSKKESICLVNLKGNHEVGYAFTVWVLSDHESSSGGNWSKILSSVSLEELGLDRKYSRVRGFTVMNGRSLIFATSRRVYDYDLSGKRETRLEKVCDHKLNLLPPELLPYSDTLRSCGIGSTTLPI